MGRRTNCTIPAYIYYMSLQQSSAPHSGEKVSDVPGVFICKESVSLFFFVFLMGTRVLRMEEWAVIAALPSGPISAQINENKFSLNSAPDWHQRRYLHPIVFLHGLCTAHQMILHHNSPVIRDFGNVDITAGKMTFQGFPPFLREIDWHEEMMLWFFSISLCTKTLANIKHCSEIAFCECCSCHIGGVV